MTDDELRDEIPEGTGGSEQITERNYSVCGAKKRQGGESVHPSCRLGNPAAIISVPHDGPTWRDTP